MLLKDLKQVNDIDSKISDMHRRLAELYHEKSLLVSDYSPEILPDFNDNTSYISEQNYRKVAKAWEQHGITIPPYSNLKNKFAKGNKTLKFLSNTHPDIASNMEIIVVPPSKYMKFPAAKEQRKPQRLVELQDYVNSGVTLPKSQRNWEVLLAYTGQSSIYAGSAKKVLETKSYMLAGYDTRALGLREYLAITYQKRELIDTETWTVLLKEPSTDVSVPYAGYRHGRYRFDMEENDNVLDDDGFRPAIKL